jgi:hypothetical protein
MATPEQEAQEVARRKRTLLLMAGGIASLLIPLAGALYLKYGGSGETKGPGRTDVFERREAGDARVTVGLAPAPVTASPMSPVAAPAPVSGGSSLSFVRGDGDFEGKPPGQPSPAAAAAPAPAAPVPQGGPIAAPEPEKGKGGKKVFSMPKLQTGKGFTQMKGFSPKPTGGAEISGIAAPAAAGKGGDMAEMLKNLPPGADKNPEIQKLLQGQGK